MAVSSNPQLRHWGTGMAFAAAAIVLALLAGLFQNELDNQRNPNREVEIRSLADGGTEVVLQRNRQGHYVASGSINGQPFEFLLDTGATTVAIPVAAANRLGLKRGAPVRMHTANGEVSGWLTQLDSVAIGPLTLSNVRATIGPGLQDGQILLGMSVLRRLDFTQSGDKLVLRAR